MDERIFIVCLDHRLEEDLLFWQTFTRVMDPGHSRPSTFLVLGSSDRCARTVEAAGGSSARKEGVLVLESQVQRDAFERATRDDGRRIVQLLSDTGVSSVGFAGFDRRILFCDELDQLSASRVGSMTAWCRSGVVPVLMSSGRNSRGEILDIHPVASCISIARQLNSNDSNQKGDIVLLLSRLPGELAERIDTGGEVGLAELDESNALQNPSYLPLIKDSSVRFLVSHVSLLTEMRAARLVSI